MTLTSVIRLSVVKAIAFSTASVSFVLFLNAWPEPVSAQVQCADVAGRLTATPSTIDRETSEDTPKTTLTWSVDGADRCPFPPIVTLERRSDPPFQPGRNTVPLSGKSGQTSAGVTRTSTFVLRAQIRGPLGTQNRDLASAKVTVNSDPGFITVSFGKVVTPDDITKFNQQWMQPWSRKAALDFARSTMSQLDSSGQTATGEWMAAMVRMFDLNHDARYLDHLFDLIQIALEFRDDRPLDPDPNVSRPLDEIRNKVGLPAWGGGLLDNYGLHSVLELTSSYYAYPIAAFARILAEDPAVRARYECKVITVPGPQTAPINRRCADAVLYANRVIETVEVFLPQIHQQRAGDFIEAMLMHPAEYSHRPTPADCDAALNDANSHEPQRKDRWQKEHGYCLDDQKLAGKPLPHNQNLLFSNVLIELSRVLDTPFYMQSPARASRAESIREFSFRIMPRQQRYFVDNLNPKSLSDNDDYPACKKELCWYYNGAPGTPNLDPEDTDHGSMDMTYVGLFFRDIDRLRAAAERSGEQFSLGDLQRFARTFVFTIAPDTNITGKNFKSDVAGRQNKNDAPEKSNSRCEGWLELARMDLRVWNVCQEMSLRKVDGQQPYLNVANHSALLNSKQFLPGP